jgi:hypothetical protein
MIPTNKLRHSLSLTSFLAGTEKQNEVRNRIIVLGGVTKKQIEVRNLIIILGG